MPYQFVRQPLTAAEAGQLAKACKTPTDRLVIWTLLDTGLRVSELCDLTSKKVLWPQRQLRVKGKSGRSGNKSKFRVVPLSRRVCRILEAHFGFAHKFPIGKRRVQDLVKEIANRAGVEQDVTPNVLRHTFAATALQKGISLATVQKILGHDRLQTTASYLDRTEVHVQEEFERKW
jgi:integrase/recombinase XerD